MKYNEKKGVATNATTACILIWFDFNLRFHL